MFLFKVLEAGGVIGFLKSLHIFVKYADFDLVTFRCI